MVTQNNRPELSMKKMIPKSTKEIWSPYIIVLGMMLRVGFFLFGKYQDEHMEVKYTDIDYLVFSDASAYVWHHGSPYMRETYRYTPLLSWLLLLNNVWYDFGKWLFIVCDLITGVIIMKLLELANIHGIKKSALSSIWLLNPMVITISTRGSSESLVTVFVMFFVYFLLRRDVMTCAIFCGIAVHFKIYPIIYLPTAILFLTPYTQMKHLLSKPTQLINDATVTFAFCFTITFVTLGAIMYIHYGYEFLEHSYLYHLTRTDHRHNFSLYNISLYFTSAIPEGIDFTKLAFLPQMIISGVLIPVVFTKKSLCDTLFLQTFAFVALNKVITSQYFIWFLIFLPLYLRNSSLVSSQKIKGMVCLILWIVTQASWLFFAFKLEFLGESTFFSQLMVSSISFFLSNIYLLGVFMDDIRLKATDGKSFI